MHQLIIISNFSPELDSIMTTIITIMNMKHESIIINYHLML